MTKSIAVTVAAAGAAAALFGGGAAGAQDGPRTISVISVEQSCRGADNGRRGDSVGDLDVCRGKLRDATTRGTIRLRALTPTRTAATIMLLP
jgi:hypothetical protein